MYSSRKAEGGQTSFISLVLITCQHQHLLGDLCEMQILGLHSRALWLGGWDQQSVFYPDRQMILNYAQV